VPDFTISLFSTSGKTSEILVVNNFEIWEESGTFEIATYEGGFSSTCVSLKETKKIFLKFICFLIKKLLLLHKTT